MHHDRRALLSAFGLALPFGLDQWGWAAAPPIRTTIRLTLRSFEEGVREAFRQFAPTDAPAWRRVALGHGPAVDAGLPGCVNDRPFAGFPPGCLRIVRAGSEPGPAVGGVRLYQATVDLVRTDPSVPGRPFDFASLPPAPVFEPADGETFRSNPLRPRG